MLEHWNLVSTPNGKSEAALKKLFGKDAIISRVGDYNLIHLDDPSPDEIEERVRNFKPEDLFEEDCPLCRLLRDQGGNVLYDKL